MYTHEILVARREKLLARYSKESLEALRLKGTDKLHEMKTRRNEMGANNHNFDGMLQRLIGLFEEMIGNVEDLRTADPSTSDQKLAELCGRADLVNFLEKREQLYDADPNIIKSTRIDLDIITTFIKELLGVGTEHQLRLYQPPSSGELAVG